MVASGGEAALLQKRTDFLYCFTGGAVNDPALLPAVFEEAKQRFFFALGNVHLEKQVGPVEAGHQSEGVLKLQGAGDVLPDLGRGGGGEGPHHRAFWQGF